VASAAAKPAVQRRNRVVPRRGAAAGRVDVMSLC
jgi:hypothetical protein